MSASRGPGLNRRWLCSATARWLGTIIIAADEALERSRVTILAEAASCGMSLVGSKKNMRPALSKNARGMSPICRRGQMLGGPDRRQICMHIQPIDGSGCGAHIAEGPLEAECAQSLGDD